MPWKQEAQKKPGKTENYLNKGENTPHKAIHQMKFNILKYGQMDQQVSSKTSIVKEGNYYANSKKFVLPSSLFMLELRARCHSQLKMVSKKLRQIF